MIFADCPLYIGLFFGTAFTLAVTHCHTVNLKCEVQLYKKKAEDYNKFLKELMVDLNRHGNSN